MKQRVRRLLISRSIEREPRAHTGQAWWKGTHRYRGPGALMTGEVGRIDGFRIYTSATLPSSPTPAKP